MSLIKGYHVGLTNTNIYPFRLINWPTLDRSIDKVFYIKNDFTTLLCSSGMTHFNKLSSVTFNPISVRYPQTVNTFSSEIKS